MAEVIGGIPVPSLAPQPAQSELRLSLAPGLARRGTVDGGWWPRSRDAAVELAELAVGLTGPLGMVARLAVDAHDWDDVPRRIKVGGRMLRVGWFPDLDHLIIVTRARQDEFLLLVVPPDTSPDSAEAMLEWAAGGGLGTRPQALPAGGRTAATRTNGGEGEDVPALRLVPDEPATTTGHGVLGDESRDRPGADPAEMGR